ncbi:MAG: 4,5-DOPA dioxygenase extradiol [Actinomycetota bacterium]|nr:4,5-DOPA dioxygenase extradiol [Actinomycetota bacterium]MDA2972710.1 4,5-DOPA dioxygenase extradiol [Actinomycetota bacterium]MDA3002190.1 4,5-DOPA dioxygenase extradiol [Actinomycetota bacterium]
MSELMPAIFVGHGSPMNALDDNRYTRAWRDIARSFRRPRAIVAVSAHWYIGATAITTMERPKTIHDFYGFPPELFAVDYPAPGSAAIAGEVIDALAGFWVGRDVDSWGIDHGTWSVLVHMYPEADVPVLQLSIDATKDLEYHVNLGRALEVLRHRGILVIGSGNIVHDLGSIDWEMPDGGFDWAHEFNDDARQVFESQPGDVSRLADHPKFRRAAPTPEHLLPAFYVAGMAAAAGATLERFVDGYAYGSLSMDSYVLR